MSSFSGIIAGYDPGGNGGHGVALAFFKSGICTDFSVETVMNVEGVIKHLETYNDLLAIGIDTLVCWCTGDSGWRPADLWLRKKYKPVQSSIVSPNGLYGSMGLNGMAVLQSTRESNPLIQVTETHPKVLYWALTGTKYDYASNCTQMDAHLSKWLGITVTTHNDHEWDAAVSILSALRGIEGAWQHDLFNEPLSTAGRLIYPIGSVNYWWPE